MMDKLLFSVIDHVMTAVIAIGWLIYMAEPLSSWLTGSVTKEETEPMPITNYNVPWNKPWYANDNWS